MFLFRLNCQNHSLQHLHSLAGSEETRVVATALEAYS